MTKPITWSTAEFIIDEGSKHAYKMWAIIPDDGTDGFIIGEWDSVIAAHAALTWLIESGGADEEVNELDERLGTKWLSVSEAAREYGVPDKSIRDAAANGRIKYSKFQNGLWKFPERTFRSWHRDKYRPKK